MSSNKFTRADIEAAAAALKRNNVPPWSCPRCGRTYYLSLPWCFEISDAVTVECWGCGATVEHKLALAEEL